MNTHVTLLLRVSNNLSTPALLPRGNSSRRFDSQRYTTERTAEFSLYASSKIIRHFSIVKESLNSTKDLLIFFFFRYQKSYHCSLKQEWDWYTELKNNIIILIRKIFCKKEKDCIRFNSIILQFPSFILYERLILDAVKYFLILIDLFICFFNSTII